MDAKSRHHRICLRLGALGSMILLLLCVATLTAKDGRGRRRHNGNSHHTSNGRRLGHHIHDHHHDQHGHHFIIHVPRHYRLPVFYARNGFYRYPFYRRPYYYGIGYNVFGYNGYGSASWPANNLTGYGGKTKSLKKFKPVNKGPAIGTIESTQQKNGWKLLADGQASLALDVFEKQAQHNPDFSGPKIGYALSVAMAGDLYFGVWEMRRASRTNHSSMQAFQLPRQLRPTVEKLIEKFKAEQAKNTRKDDVSFMLASLHYLMQNPNSAKAAIDRAIREGDRSQSTLNLKQRIDLQVTKAQADHVGIQKNPVGEFPSLISAPPIPDLSE